MKNKTVTCYKNAAKIAITFLFMAAVNGNVANAADSVQNQLSQESVIETIKKANTIRVGVSTFVPWAMRDKNGELIGFEIDVATKLSEDMGVQVEFIPTAWDGIIPALLSAKFDVIIAGMSVTAERNLTVNFTNPYEHSSMGVLANKSLASEMTWPADYNNSDVTFSCRRGSTPCGYIKDNFPKATLRQFDDQGQVIQEVLNGNAHAFVSAQPEPAFTAFDNPEVAFNPTDEKIEKGNESFVLRKGDPDALNFFNNWILVNTTNGWLQKRHDYWFGGREWADLISE